MSEQSNMAANPILAEFVRGNMVENKHRGAFCVVDEHGKVIASAGEVDAMIYPRSAIKSLQALALFQSGAVEKFELSDQDLALACASHKGEEFHVQGVSTFLAKIGMTAADLECGAHAPFGKEARKLLRNSGQQPTALHNNCSGKHTGMLAVAKALGVDPKGYIEREHPVQVLVRECVERVLEVPLTPDHCGRDGCSIPTWGAPLKSFAHAFAKMSSGSNALPAIYAAAGDRLFNAAASNAELVSGTNGFDTDAMKAFAGDLMLKVGADGVFCGALRSRNWGFALKCDDGNMDAAHAIVAGLLSAIGGNSEKVEAVLSAQKAQITKNWRGFEVGHMQSSGEIVSYF
ncbi:asparaginase [Maritalea porphyrae]|uniref:asparaginase n=1 Tax=Maritalea porphyrae TaxID=880732 RepID=UPI0022AF9992|nr:asparaginase [Maritalea porphyrae]MCZ4271196.1 asparaginase [Maritalea porphyrae]